MAAVAVSKTAPPRAPSPVEKAQSSYETAVRVASMPAPLDEATAMSHVRATLSACNVAASALRTALARVESKIEETSRSAVDTSSVAAAAAEYARASAERVSAQSVAESLCPDAVESARLGSPTESTTARSLAARVELLRQMAVSAYEVRPELRIAEAKKAHSEAVAALEAHKRDADGPAPKKDPVMSEEALELWRSAFYVRVAEYKGDSCPPMAKERAIAGQAKLDAASDADAKEAMAKTATCITKTPQIEGKADAARAMLARSGAKYAERARLQQAVTDAQTRLDAATKAAESITAQRGVAEKHLADAQAELQTVTAATPAASAASSAPAATSTDEDPESVSGSASSARLRFAAAVQAEADALAALNQAQAGGSSMDTLTALQAEQADLRRKLEEVEKLTKDCNKTSE